MSGLATSLPMDAVADFCRRWSIARLEVFGSILRADFGPHSDVDFLVTWEGAVPPLFTQFDMADELSRIVGRRVDLIPREEIETSPNRFRRKAILDSSRVVYAA
jgi:predicted nucleotidyltransferase